jgi:serine/threonine protein kinase/DNA-binding CsgD family transcriptional regulator
VSERLVALSERSAVMEIGALRAGTGGCVYAPRWCARGLGHRSVGTARTESMSTDLVAGRYRLGALLGRGAMGEVWLVDDLVLHRKVAIKRPCAITAVPDDAGDRVVREARMAARISHPNAVAVYDLLVEDGRPNIVMEFVAGISLAERLRRDGPLSAADAARFGSHIAAALEAAHRLGIVHRDVKPAKVLLASDRVAKLADFGTARSARDATLTETDPLIGTPTYLAPEVARGGTPRTASDIWSLGATIYMAVEGRSPFDRGGGNELAALTRIATEPVPPPTSIGALAPLLERMLSRDPAARPSAEQARRSLASLASSAATSMPVASTPRSGTPSDAIRAVSGRGRAADPCSDTSSTAPLERSRGCPTVAAGGAAACGWKSLTAAELRIARLVAEGLTNQAIARQLVLSRHTVDSHVKHAFAKLGIRSRVELTREVLAHDTNLAL